MVADQPIVSYSKEKKANKKEMDALADEWAQRHKSRVGEKINLSDYLINKEHGN